MNLKCGVLSRCMARPCFSQQHNRRACNLLVISTPWPPKFLGLQLRAADFFSTRATAKRGRLKYVSRRLRINGATRYPAFRNETQHQRMIRENQLFNPFERRHDNEDQRRASQASSHSGTLPLALASSSGLEDEMVYLASHTDGHRSKPLNILATLLNQRGRELQGLHFETLIALNASPRHGAASKIKSLLEEMEQLKISRDINTHTAVLRSLMVHPDIDLLNETLEACAAMWYELDAEMLHYVTAIYLRLNMLDMALDYLDRIEGRSSSSVTNGKSGQAQLWIYVLFIEHLAQKKDWDGVLRICYRLNDDPSIGPFSMRQLDIPHSFWLRLLTQCIEDRDLWMTLWIWRIWVLRAWILPPISTCVEALAIFTEHSRHEEMHSAIQIIKTIRKSHGESDKPLKIRRAAALSTVDKAVRQAEKSLESVDPPKNPVYNAAHWTAFQHDSLSRTFAPDGLKIDPWSVLAENNADPANLWVRTQKERHITDERPDLTRRFQKLAKKKANEDAAMVSSWPKEMRDDIDRVTRLVFDLRFSEFTSGLSGHFHEETFSDSNGYEGGEHYDDDGDASDGFPDD